MLREHGTERPGASPLNAEKRQGEFLCAACQTKLFDSGTKYESHSGWPSFYAPVEGAVATTEDRTLGMRRVGGALRQLRRPSGPRVPGRAEAHRPALLHERRRAEVRTRCVSAAEDAAVLDELRALLAGETDVVANAANMAALLYQRVPRLNWVGFYFLRDGELVVGPFQGLPACTRIPLGRGVCGTAAARRETIVVPDVHAFDGHIACDGATLSEIVVPLLLDDTLLGVLDVDSPELERFSAGECAFFEAAGGVFVKAWGFSPNPVVRSTQSREAGLVAPDPICRTR